MFRRSRRICAGALAAALALDALTMPAQAAGPPATATRGDTVTLITGDKVVIHEGGRGAAFVPGPGRRHVSAVRHRTVDGHLHVLPDDAVRLVAAGKLDRRLFDVTGLLDDRYDDASRPTIPLIVTGHQAGRIRAAVAAGRELAAIGATAGQVTKASAATSWPTLAAAADGIEKIWLDAKLRPVLDQSVPRIGAPEAWQAGYTGQGVKVAVLDSGVDADHPDLRGKVAAAKNFTGEPDGDTLGHGTHIAATIGGTGQAPGGHRGVAPDAEILDGKVCGELDCRLSEIIDGMHWAAVEQRADIVNVSIGFKDTPEVDPLEQTVDALTARTGALFVVAAGNAGPNGRTVTSPGSADAALTVGAVDRADRIASFSGRGPRIGDGAVKPDVTAPGVDIVAAKAEGGLIGDPVDRHHVRLSGTSMATPHAAGAAALLVQQHPTWSGPRLKALLMASAEPASGPSAYDQGAGRIDLRNAITRSLVSEPASLSFGIVRWPHTDDEPVSRTISYHNPGNAPVDLTLRGELTGPGGAPAPAGGLRLSTTRLTVPAGGTASLTVTVDTRHEGPDGAYSGWIVASTAGGPAVVTPLGVDKEVESYQLTVRPLDSTGRPAPNADMFVTSLETGATSVHSPENGAIRIPKGRYMIGGRVFVGDQQHWIMHPTVELARNLTVDLDARLTKPVRVTVERASAQPMTVDMAVTRLLGGDDWTAVGFAATSFDRLYSAEVGPDAPTDGLSTVLSSQWADPGADGTFENSPISYHLVDSRPGRFFTGFDRTVRDRDLARITARHSATQSPAPEGRKTLIGTTPDAFFGFGVVPPLITGLPHTTTHLVEAGGTQWQAGFDEVTASGLTTTFYGDVRSYAAGGRYPERWNAAVFGPALATGSAVRIDDALIVNVPMYADQAGHAGFSDTDDATTRLFRNGNLIAETGTPGFVQVTVPPEPAAYRLHVSSDRPGLSASIDATWTFASDPAGGFEALPLWEVRFAPEVDDHNRAEAGPVTVLPITARPQPGAEAGHLTRLVVKVSGDDGRTWRQARVVPSETGGYLAIFATPPRHGYVSLRATAADSAGNTVDQAVIRAYAVG